MNVEKSKVYIGPEEGERLPVLGTVHKIGARAPIEEWVLPPGQMIPPHAREDEVSFVQLGATLRAEGESP